MDNLAINEQPQALAQYSRHQIDRTYADQYETVLGHLICERGRSVKAALEDLRPIVSQTRRETLSAVDWCQKLGFGGLGVGILVGAGMGMGFAILPILAGTISIKFWADSRSELPRRDAEYHLLKTTPNLPEVLYALHLRGVTAVKIVGAYDQLVAAIEARLEGNGEFTEAEVGEFLQAKVSGDMGLDTTAPATATAETQVQSGLQNGEASNAPRTESPALAPTIADKTYICVQSVGTIPDHTQTGTPRKLAEKLALAQGFAWSDLKTQDEKEQKNGLPWFNFLFENKSCYPSDFWCRLYEQPIASGVAAAAPSMSVVNGVETIAPRDIATDLGKNPQSALIFGTPGAGKGMNISNAIRTLRAKLPNVTVMMVDPKGDKKEIGYWESQVDIFESRALLKSSPRSSAEWMLRCVEKFSQIDGPKLLVWDELFASITVLKGQNVPKGEDAFPCLTDFQQFISLNLSLGPSSGIWVWGMSQSANLSDLGLTSGGLSTTRIIALVSPDNTGAVEGYLATKAITAPKGGMDTIDRLMEESPVGRACYDGKTKRWYPMARLENHSGFDRDSADWNNLNKVAPMKPTKNLEDVFSPEFFNGHPLLEEPTIAPPSEPEWKAYQEIPQESPDDATPKKETYEGWAEYPIHQAVLKYLSDKEGKTDRDIYDAIRRRRNDSEWESVPGTDNMSKLRTILKYLAYNRKISATPKGLYSGIG